MADSESSEVVEVALGSASYSIHIEAGWLNAGKDGGLLDLIPTKAIVVTNPTISKLYLEPVKALLGDKFAGQLLVEDGEHSKSVEVWSSLLTQLLEMGVTRSTTLIALGGGVIGDLVGFVAASYQRGMNFIQMPTTLLAQVDSSVGGKTGLNHPLGKNMIGAFYQPKGVFIDLENLDTLPRRQLASGLMEVVKYGLIMDKPFYEWCVQNIEGLLNCDRRLLSYAIKKSCECKANIVAQDEREAGIRAILNLGHTFGHAIEAFSEYKGVLHGEAVGIGTLMAMTLCERMGTVSASDVQAFRELLAAMDMPTEVPEGMTPEDFRFLMSKDKKNVDRTIRLVLLEHIGKAVVTDQYDQNKLDDILIEFC